MKQTILIFVMLMLASALWSAPNPFAAGVRPTEPLTPAEEAKSFHLAPGFRIQLFASEPQINKPMNMAFDTRGRLWVTSTVEYPHPAKPGTKGRDTVKVLEDTNGDGHADKVTTFADGLNIPTGIYPYKDGAIVWSIPNIWLLRDTNGDGRADKREVLFGPLGFERDTHGMNSSFTRGFDGWLHITHGFNNHTTVRASNGSSINMQSGNTYRVRVDGSSVEQFTWGQVNPFGMCLDPRGNFYSADCHSSPIYQLIPGAYYPSFGKPHDGLGYAPRTIVHSHGSTAICGILYYADNLWPKKYHGNLFVGNVMTSRVNRDQLAFHGSSPKGRELPDFIRSDDPWFRPVDLQLGPDGALYIADFYNRIIGHYEVPLNHPGRDRTRGRIWRVTYEGKTHPKLDLSTPSKTIVELGHANLTRRLLAMNHLADTIGKSAVIPIRNLLANKQASPEAKIHGAWTLHRLGKLSKNELLSLNAASPLVRVHALRILGDIDKWNPRHSALVIEALQATDPHVRRAAGETMARHPSATHVAPMAAIIQKTALADALQVGGLRGPDDHLLHTLSIALRNQLRAPGAFAAVRKLPNTHHELINRTALAVASREAGDYLIAQLPRLKGDLTPSIRHAARHGSGAGVDLLPPIVERQFAKQPGEQAKLFKALQEGTRLRGGYLPNSVRAWGGRLAERLLAEKGSDSRFSERQKAGAEIARDLKLTKVTGHLRKLVVDTGANSTARIAAMQAVVSIQPPAEVLPVLLRILENTAEPDLLREETVKATAAHGWMQPTLAKALATAPAALQIKFARALSAADRGAVTLLNAIKAGKAPATLLLDGRVRENLSASHKQAAAQLTQGAQPPKADLAKALATRLEDYRKRGGDAKRGEEMFKAACAACHQLNGAGGNIGPQLDGIANRGIERVVEDILDPNRNVDIAFRYALVKLRNGQTIVGLKRREVGMAVVFADLTGKEMTIPKAAIVSQKQTGRSLMPDNLAEALLPADFNALLAYLFREK